MTLFNQPKQSMSSINQNSRNELDFIEAIDKRMTEFVHRFDFYPAQTIEITTSLGDACITYRVERGEIKSQ
jgi:hypothetical protein